MRFQVGVDKQTGREIAMKVVSVRQRVRARVESVKGQVSVFFFLLKFISPWGRGIFSFVPRSRFIDLLVVRVVFKRCMHLINFQFGFIAYENEEGKNLFFHMSEVEGEVELQVSRKHSPRIIPAKGFR